MLRHYINEETKAFLDNHRRVAGEIKNDVEKWQQSSSIEARRASIIHFAEESALVEGVLSSDTNAALSSLGTTRENYESLTSVAENKDEAVDLHHFEIRAEQLFQEKGSEHFDSDAEALHYSLSKSLSDSLNKRQTAYEQKLIDDSRQIFLSELYRQIDQYKQLEAALQPIIDFFDTGTLWDMSSGSFSNYGFDILRFYAETINNNESISELAKILGRQSVSSREVEQEMIEKTVARSAFHPQIASSGEVVGIEFSGDINRVVPSEMGRLGNPDTEMLFYSNLIEKKLLSYSYLTQESYLKSETFAMPNEKEKQDLCGPIIACVDTSGSMSGAPEITAKTLLLAIAKKALTTKRKCYIISFSREIETLDISDFKGGNALQTLIAFLNRSFNGGTDAYPALCEAVRILQKSEYKNSDVIMVSDLIMPNIPNDIIASIETEKTNGTNFYSFVIGRSANNNAVKIFNDTILYNPYSEEGRKSFARQINQIAKRILP